MSTGAHTDAVNKGGIRGTIFVPLVVGYCFLPGKLGTKMVGCIQHIRLGKIGSPMIGILIATLIYPSTRTPVPGNTAIVKTIVQGSACGPIGRYGRMNLYPHALCNAPLDTVRDRYGFWNRECGSYAAFAVAHSGRVMLPESHLGLPGFWPRHVPVSWLDSSPRVGDVAVVPANPGLPTGHVMFVVSPNWHGTGDLLVKAYNAAPFPGLGLFSEQVWRRSGAVNGYPFSLVFIRFPKG